MKVTGGQRCAERRSLRWSLRKQMEAELARRCCKCLVRRASTETAEASVGYPGCMSDMGSGHLLNGHK